MHGGKKQREQKEGRRKTKGRQTRRALSKGLQVPGRQRRSSYDTSETKLKTAELRNHTKQEELNYFLGPWN